MESVHEFLFRDRNLFDSFSDQFLLFFAQFIQMLFYEMIDIHETLFFSSEIFVTYQKMKEICQF